MPFSDEILRWDHFGRKSVKSAAKIPSSNEIVSPLQVYPLVMILTLCSVKSTSKLLSSNGIMIWDHFGRKSVKSAAKIPSSDDFVMWDHFGCRSVKFAAKLPFSNEIFYTTSQNQ